MRIPIPGKTVLILRWGPGSGDGLLPDATNLNIASTVPADGLTPNGLAITRHSSDYVDCKVRHVSFKLSLAVND